MTIAFELKRFRQDCELSQPKAAEVLSVPVCNLRQWEQGRRTPTQLSADMLRHRMKQYRRGQGRRQTKDFMKQPQDAKPGSQQQGVSMTIGDYRKMSPTALRNHTFRLWMKLGQPCTLPPGGARTREEMIAFAERLLAT